MNPRMPSANDARPITATGPLASETPRRGRTVSSYLSSVRAIACILLEAVISRIPRRGREHAFASVLLTLALPASAAAAPFEELPFRTVPTAALCLRATGVPGELLRWTRGGVELMQARADGLTPTGTVTLGTISDCPQVAADATTGATIVAAAGKRAIRIVQRAPGGAWGAPTAIKTGGFAQLSVATSARGDALVAWVDVVGPERTRIRAALKPAGAATWTTQTLSPRFDLGAESG